MKRLPTIFTALCLLHPATTRAEELPTLETGLARAAGSILTRLRDDGHRNVGVLKFLVAREGEDRFSDSVGTLNLLLARRLEVALVVKNSPRDPLGILDNPSAVAARLPGASHLSREGLDKLFAAEYPLAWGKEKVRPDALIVGTGLIGRDLRTLHLAIHAIDAKTRRPKPLVEDLAVRVRPEHLVELGESFHRGCSGGGAAPPAWRPQTREEAVWDEARQVREKGRPHPAVDPAAPFVLEVLYDGEVQKVEVRGGQAWVPEPSEGQKVVVRYTRRDRSGEVFGVVVKLNGQNTLDREKLPDAQCRCWLSYPQEAGQPQSLEGFQVGANEAEEFRVASREESRRREVYYGSDVGTISMTVFPQRKEKKPPLLLGYDEKDEQLIRRSELRPGEKKAASFAQLQQRLYEGLDRGLILDGGRMVESRIRVVRFQHEPTPAMTVTLRYYRP
jgi:hypothetical protein